MSAAPVVGTAWSRKPKRVVIAASVGSGVAYNFEGGTGTATLKHFLEEFEPATEKAAPIPADIQLIAGTLVIPVSKTLSQEQCNDLFGAIMKALVADRASQEERILEDEREALARHMAAEYAQHETGYDWELTDRIWQDGWRKAADRALAAMDRARLRGDAEAPE